VEKKLTGVSYVLCADNDARVARVHVNMMRRWDCSFEENAREPEAGKWPDSRRVLPGIPARREKEGKRV
jgi:hypothetical protein